jgi:hypothetical protein
MLRLLSYLHEFLLEGIVRGLHCCCPVNTLLLLRRPLLLALVLLLRLTLLLWLRVHTKP